MVLTIKTPDLPNIVQHFVEAIALVWWLRGYGW